MSNRYAQFDALLAKMKQIHDAKGHDYEGDGRPYENLRAGEDWNIEAWKYAMLRADEKMRRLKSFAKKGTLKNESALDSFLDIAVLAAIGYVLFEEETATATPPPQSRASACTPQSPCVPHPAPAPASPSCSTD
jgi:hypothetical protein